MHSPGRRLWTAGCQSRQDRGSGGEAHTNTARLDLPGRHTAFTFTPSLASDASLRRSSPTLTRCCVLGADERESVQGCAHRLLPRLNAHLATPPDLDGGAGDQRQVVVTEGAGGHTLGPGRVGLHVEHPGRPDSEKRHVRRVVSPKQLRTGSPGSPRPALARHRRTLPRHHPRIPSAFAATVSQGRAGARACGRRHGVPAPACAHSSACARLWGAFHHAGARLCACRLACTRPGWIRLLLCEPHAVCAVP